MTDDLEEPAKAPTRIEEMESLLRDAMVLLALAEHYKELVP